ncbi:unnamed protein product [Rhizoctonia solani]|uniref:Uncharacterized protein n=1 Tax=Rhizoctonia solani TaxID=456999 RepID=A0A8H3CIL6_9AGAM|nr:unnamed protein product [Rhizoctonia solani]
MAASNTSPGVFGAPWEGDNKIVIGIDIGTHNSGAAFVYLSKGAQPLIHRVASWPGQAAIDWQSKIPTIVLYDANMRPLSIGAEAVWPGVQEGAEGQRWSRAMNFKLQPPPESLKSHQSLWLDVGVNPSPQNGASLKQVYSDYLKYLLVHTEAAFRERVLDADRVWTSLVPTMELIITHPSGWGAHEQALLRLAAVEAGYGNTDQATANINFLSEAEAAVHFYMYHSGSSLKYNVQAGTSFLVCDIGISTTVINICTVESTRPMLKMKHHCSSACNQIQLKDGHIYLHAYADHSGIQTGSKAIDRELEQYLRRAFTDAGLPNDSTEEYTKNAVQDFEKTTKYRFSDTNVDYRINLGNARYLTDSTLRVRRGTMTLPGALVKSFFDPCIQEVLKGVDQQIQGIHAPFILLLGGLGDNPYLRQEFKKRYEPQGSSLPLPGDSTSKAYALGALLWSTITALPNLNTLNNQPQQTGNTTQFYDPCLSRSYGFETSIPYDYASHEGRYITTNPSGIKVVQGDLLEGFRESFRISVDLTPMTGALEPRIGLYGVINWHIGFDICLNYQVDGFHAEVQWQEQGEIQTSSITTRPQDV